MLASAVRVGGCAPGSRAAFGGGGAALVPSWWYALPRCGSWRLPWCPFPLCLGPRSCPFLVLGWFPGPMLCLFRRPVLMGACPHLGPLRPLLPECPLLSLALPLPLSFPFLVWWWRGEEAAPMAQVHPRKSVGLADARIPTPYIRKGEPVHLEDTTVHLGVTQAMRHHHITLPSKLEERLARLP